MRGLDPRIHTGPVRRRDVDGRNKCDHDVLGAPCPYREEASLGLATTLKRHPQIIGEWLEEGGWDGHPAIYADRTRSP